MKKPRSQVFNTKVTVAKLGSGASKRPPNPLSPGKKNYSKAEPVEAEKLVSNANFGMTGLTGES